MQELVLGVLEHGGVQHQSFTVQLEHDALHRHSFSLQLELSGLQHHRFHHALGALMASNLCELVLGVLEHGGVQHQSFTIQLEHDALHRHRFSLQLELSWPAASKVSPCIRSADGFKHQSLTIATEAGSC
eukprot:jgi/Chrzof1/6307/Cz18g01050.t1